VATIVPAKKNERQYHVGSSIQIGLNHEIIEARVRVIVEHTDGTRLQVDFGQDETALIHEWQVVKGSGLSASWCNMAFLPLPAKSNSGFPMTEERKYAILFAATVLSARKLAAMESDKPSPAKMCAVDRAIDQAKFILDRIEARWPNK
jgi:hypothetical protein